MQLKILWEGTYNRLHRLIPHNHEYVRVAKISLLNRELKEFDLHFNYDMCKRCGKVKITYESGMREIFDNYQGSINQIKRTIKYILGSDKYKKVISGKFEISKDLILSVEICK